LDGATNSNTNGDSVVLTWRASSDNIGVSTYIIYRDGAEIGTTADTRFTDTNVLAGSTYVYTIVAVDAAGNRSDTSTPLSIILPSDESSDESSENAVVRVNCGGDRFQDASGNDWAADTGYNGGHTHKESTGIAGTSDDVLYRSHRWDPKKSPELEYSFSIPNGDYLVKLHFAEIYSGTFGVGLRKFGIMIEGAVVEKSLDVFAEVGADTALISSYPVSVKDGQLNIRFVHNVENPMISAIEVLPTTANTDLMPPPAPSQLTGTVSASGDTVTLKWSSVVDSNGDGIDGYTIYRDGSQIGYTSKTSFTDDTVELGHTYIYEVSAVDKAFNESTDVATVQVTTDTNSSAEDERVTIRVNTGGKAFTDHQGDQWSADAGYNGGQPYKQSTAIAGTSDDTLYCSHRWDPKKSPELEYSFSIPNGDYIVKLHFAEIYSGTCGVGRRKFDIMIEGAVVEKSLDVFAEVGAKTALINSYPVSVKDGQLNLRFIHKVENPMISGIEILPK
jgi:chitodextrinase